MRLAAAIAELLSLGDFTRMTFSWHRAAVILTAIPVFLYFPVAAAHIATTGKQLVFGFDDMPLGAMIMGLAFGLIVAVSALAFICYRVYHRRLRIPVILIIIGAVVDLAALPVARWITRRVEHPERYSEQSPNKSLEPTAAPLSGLARLPFRATASSGCGSALIR
jgi:hypothetical protein